MLCNNLYILFFLCLLFNSSTMSILRLQLAWSRTNNLFYHILVDNIAKLLSCVKTLSNKRNHVYFTQFHKNGPSGLIKASLLIASGMLLHAFPSMFVSLLHATSWISGKLSWSIWQSMSFFISYSLAALIHITYLETYGFRADIMT